MLQSARKSRRLVAVDEICPTIQITSRGKERFSTFLEKTSIKSMRQSLAAGGKGSGKKAAKVCRF
jgi:hypothetical protein